MAQEIKYNVDGHKWVRLPRRFEEMNEAWEIARKLVEAHSHWDTFAIEFEKVE